MKKLLSLILSITMIVSMETVAFADNTSEVTANKLPYVIEPQFERVGTFNKYGVAEVHSGYTEDGRGILGVINLKGEKIFGFDGTEFAIRKNGLIMAVGENDKAAFFSSEGKQLTDYVYETFKRVQPKTPHTVTYHYVTDYFDGDGESDLVPICKDGKFGFINSKGEEAIAPTFDYVFGFYEGISKIGYDGVLSEYGTYTQCKFGYINENGEVLPTGELWAADNFINGYAKIADGQYKVIDKNGQAVQFTTGVYEFTETNGNFILAGHDGGHVVLDMNGNLLSNWAPNIQLFGKSFIIWQRQIADINGNIIYTAPEGMRIYPLYSNDVVRVSAGSVFIDGAASFEGDALVNQNGEVVLQTKEIKEVAEGIFYTPEGQALYDVNGTCIAMLDGCDVYTSNQLSHMLLPVQSAETNKWGYVELPQTANPYVSEYTESSIYHVEKIIPTDYGTVLYFWPVGAPHGGKSPNLTLIKEDGSKISLSESVSRADLWHHPEHENIVLEEDGKTLTFSVSFEEKSEGSIAGGEIIVLHDAGTYYYKADLETGICIETKFQPLDTIGDDVLSAWAKPEIEKAIGLGFVPIAMRENYKRNITRREFAEIAMYFLSVQYGYQPEHIIRTYYNLDKEFPMKDFVSLYCAEKSNRTGTDWFRYGDDGGVWEYEYKRNDDPRVLYSVHPFTDVDESSSENHLIGLAYNFGIINGISETEFNPDGEITRQEAAAMLMRVYRNYAYFQDADMGTAFADDAQIADWAKKDVYNVKAFDIMQGIGENTFAPLEHYTVEQAIATFLRLYESAPVSRKNRNIEPLLDYEFEKEHFYVNVPGTSWFSKEQEFPFESFTVIIGSRWRLHGRGDNKIFIVYKYGGIRDLTSFVPVAQENHSPIEDVTVSADESVVSFVTSISDTFRLYNQLNGTEKVYSIGKYRFEIDVETGNIIGLERIE